MANPQSMWAESAWKRLVENRRRRDRRRSLGLSLLAIGCVTLLGLFLLRGDRLVRLAPLTIQEIVVSGNRSVGREEILGLLPVESGDPWWSLDRSEVRRVIEAHPRIEQVSLRYVWFHQLHLEVVERRAALAVLGAANGELTSDGWFLPRRPVGETLDLPILRMAKSSTLKHGSRGDAQTVSLARLVERLHRIRPDLWQEFSEIEIDGAIARVYLRSAPTVIVFSPGDHEELWNRVPAVLDDLHRRGHTDALLDLRFEGRIVVRLPEGGAVDTLTTGNLLERV